VRDGPVNSTARHGAQRGANRTVTCGGAVATSEQWAAGAAGGRAACGLPGSPLTSCSGANARGVRTPGRGPVSACVYGGADDAARATSRARARLTPFEIHLALFEQEKLPILQLKCYQQSIPKL
jgi:hypothetical protein